MKKRWHGLGVARAQEEEKQMRHKKCGGRGRGEAKSTRTNGGEEPEDDPDTKQKNGKSRISSFESPSIHPPKTFFGARRYLERVLEKEGRKRDSHVRIASKGNPIPNARHNCGRRRRSLTIPEQIEPAAITTWLVCIPCTWCTAVSQCRVRRARRQGISAVCTRCVQKSTMDA